MNVNDFVKMKTFYNSNCFLVIHYRGLNFLLSFRADVSELILDYILLGTRNFVYESFEALNSRPSFRPLMILHSSSV